MQAISFSVQCLVNQTPEGVYWAAIKLRLDKNYVLYENEYTIAFFPQNQASLEAKCCQKEILQSNTGKILRFEFSTHALRCIDKAGGFDNYITNTKDKWLHSREAIELFRTEEAYVRIILKCKNQGMPRSQIRKEVFPQPKVSKHVHIPKTYTTRFYFDWRGPRKQVVYC